MRSGVDKVRQEKVFCAVWKNQSGFWPKFSAQTPKPCWVVRAQLISHELPFGLLPKWNVLLLRTNSRDGSQNGERRDFTALGTQGWGCSRKLLEGRGSSKWFRHKYLDSAWRNTNIWILDQETFSKILSFTFECRTCWRKFLQESRTLPWNTDFGILMKAQESGNQLKPSGLQRAPANHHCK